jgi:alanine racemase
MRPTRMEINLSNLTYNIRQIKSKLDNGAQIMAVIKASAYGAGADRLMDTLKKEGISNFAVAIPEEGRKLRQVENNINILILNQPSIDEIDTIIENNLTCGVCLLEFVKELDKYAKKYDKIMKVHLEIDTGAGRNGILPKDVPGFLNELRKLGNIYLEGVFTHFSCADSDECYTRMQLEKFDEVINYIKDQGIKIDIIHCASSGAILNFPEAHYNMVRPGILLYGYYPNKNQREKIDIKPINKLISKVNFLKSVPKNSGISYDKTFITGRDSIIAVVPIGYADGYKRMFSNRADVLIKGMRAKVVGKVCMDMIMVDVTDIPNVKVGDDVYLFDNEIITVDELADIAQTISYEIISTVSDRVPRVYVN